MNNNLVIGLDFGSDSVRALLVDAQDGTIKAEAQHDYQRWARQEFCNPAISQFRQHPQDYLDGMTEVITTVLKGIDPNQVAAIGVDTTGSTVCPVNHDGTPLALLDEFQDNPNAMFLLWKDHTAIAEADHINTVANAWPDNYLQYVGGDYSCEWLWSKALHVINQDPAVAQAAFSWVEHCDWMTAELTGNTNPQTMKRSRCAAGHKAMWHQNWGGLPPADFLQAIDPRLADLRPNLFTDTQTADQPVGHLSAIWAAKLGLTTQTMVAGGQLDCHAGAVGAGITPGNLIKVVGTSTCDIIVTPPTDTCIPGICGQVDGSVVPGYIGYEAGQASFGDVYHWLQNFLSAHGQSVSIETLTQEAEQLPLETVGQVLALDWFNGRRSPDANPHLQGALFGLTLGTTPAMVFRALVEATCCGARRIVQRFQDHSCAVDTITAVGGIARKSPLVMQTMANILNMPIRILGTSQACALGSAMNAATAAGLYSSLTDAMKTMTPDCDRIYTPQPHAVPIYENLYQTYLKAADLVEQFSR